MFGCGYCHTFFVVPTKAAPDNPKIANYYLGQLRSDSSFVEQMSQYNLVIFTPSQIRQHSSVVSRIKEKNPNMIVLAYVPSQSYNTRFWPTRSSVYSSLRMQDDWWLRDSVGNIISPWPDLQHTNMSRGWTEGFVSFVNNIDLKRNKFQLLTFNHFTCSNA